MAKKDTAQNIWLSERVHWIGAFDPSMRNFDVILKTPNGTTYNSYAVRGSEGVAIIDTVKAECAEQFFNRLEAVVDYSEISVIVLNHLEPDQRTLVTRILAIGSVIWAMGRQQAFHTGAVCVLIAGKRQHRVAVPLMQRVQVGILEFFNGYGVLTTILPTQIRFIGQVVAGTGGFGGHQRYTAAGKFAIRTKLRFDVVHAGGIGRFIAGVANIAVTTTHGA